MNKNLIWIMVLLIILAIGGLLVTTASK